MKILLVEDNELIVKGLKFSLEQEGFEVEIATKIGDINFESNYDLIILDIGLDRKSVV